MFRLRTHQEHELAFILRLCKYADMESVANSNSTLMRFFLRLRLIERFVGYHDQDNSRLDKSFSKMVSRFRGNSVSVVLILNTFDS